MYSLITVKSLCRHCLVLIRQLEEIAFSGSYSTWEMNSLTSKMLATLRLTIVKEPCVTFRIIHLSPYTHIVSTVFEVRALSSEYKLKLPSTIVNILLALSGNTNLMTLRSYRKCLNEYTLIQTMQRRYTMNVSMSLLTLNEMLCCPSFISILCCSIAIKICSAFC